ncbi:LysE family transporter [Tabrizicola sp. J26]|uniref:LysE family translocator n=1 Tax=Alitabrizicola rongguiensis TaxID=2909234 RepID=UPI001F17725B|nr:LysE family transporter [Tabrizicola rongguiensis]MCF1709084.1 LysE family transporter [Tabrizicola rongguiensis]
MSDMMTPLAFSAALIALLFSPGPTNTLLAVGGASRGLRRSLGLTVAEVTAYLLVVTPLSLFGGPFLQGHPSVAETVRLVAATWVIYLAVRLWQAPPVTGPDRTVTPVRIFVTTLLNPKGLIIGLAVLPATGSFTALLPWLAGLAGIIILASLCWIGAGAVLGRLTESGLPKPLRRGAAGYLGIVALGLVASAI